MEQVVDCPVLICLKNNKAPDGGKPRLHLARLQAAKIAQHQPFWPLERLRNFNWIACQHQRELCGNMPDIRPDGQLNRQVQTLRGVIVWAQTEGESECRQKREQLPGSHLIQPSGDGTRTRCQAAQGAAFADPKMCRKDRRSQRSQGNRSGHEERVAD